MITALETLPERIAGALGQPKPPDEPVKSVNLQVLPAQRPSKKLQQALDWLHGHPDRVHEPSRDLATEIGVSHMTVHKAQQMMKDTD